MSNKSLFIAYVIGSVFLLLNVIGDSLYQLSVAGYWSDRILFWLWFFGTFFILTIFWKTLLTKIYVGILIVGLVLSIIPMMIPFFAIMLSTTGAGLHFKKRIKPKYRLQVVGYGVMGRPLIEIVENRGLFEKRIANTNQHVRLDQKEIIAVWEINDAKFISETNTSITIRFFGNNLSGQMAILKTNN